MNKVLLIALLLLLNLTTFSQLGWNKILNADTCRIEAFKHFKVSYDSRELIYVRYSIPDQPVHSDQALYYGWIKLDKNSAQWIVKPHNSFLHSFPFYCPWPNALGWRYYKVDNFALSTTDPALILQTRDVPPCGISIQEPKQDTRLTLNNGSNYVTYENFGNGFLGNTCGGFDIDPVKDSIMYFCYYLNNQKYVYKTSNRGTNWNILDTVNTVSSYGYLKVNPMRRNDIFIRSAANMLKSTSAGTDFVNVGGASFTELIFNRVDSSIYGYSGTNIYRSTNHGSNWSVISAIPSANIRAMEINPDNQNIMYAGNDSGLYRSTNKGVNWAMYNNSFLPSRRVIGLLKDAGSGDTLYAATIDAVYKVWGGFIAIGISGNNSVVPGSYYLKQNYPNPFNPITKISFGIPEKSKVRIAVYDVLGNRVSVLIESELTAGSYDVDWDAGEQASGVYFYKIETEKYTETKKMLLVK